MCLTHYEKEKVNALLIMYSIFFTNLMMIDGEGHVSKGTSPFILIVGSFTPDQVIEILDGFLNTVRILGYL
jgi:hypothetical protein